MRQNLKLLCVILCISILGCVQRDYTKNGSKKIELPQAFQSEELGIQFKFPADWEHTETLDGQKESFGNDTANLKIFSVDSYVGGDGMKMPLKLVDLDYAKVMMDVSTDNEGNAQAEKGTFAGRECVKCWGRDNKNRADGKVVTQYFFIHRKRGFIITTQANPENEKKDREIFNAILGTMILTDN